MAEWKTAVQIIAELNSSPEFLARARERELAREAKSRELSAAELPLVDALHGAGIDVKSVWDLPQREGGYAEAIPVLFDHVKVEYPDRIREGILRAMATQEARGRWNDLLMFFEKNTLRLSPELHFFTAVALAGAADDSVIDDVIRLAGDRRHGSARLPLLHALQQSDNPKAKAKILELRADPDLGKEVKKLRRLKRIVD